MNISAVLLAGGESRRMGKDKATLLFRGEPLWRIQLDLLRKLAPVEILISGRNDPAWRPADVYFVADAPPSRGPLSGIMTEPGPIPDIGPASLACHQTKWKTLVPVSVELPVLRARPLW